MQPPEVAGRIPQAIGVIDAQAADLAFGQQPEHQLMGRLEHLGAIHANGGQVVHIEKAPVVDLLGRDAPVAQAVGLPLDQRIQHVEAARVAALAVEAPHRLLDRGAHFGRRIGQRRQPALEDLLLAPALDHFGALGLGARRQVLQAGHNALVFQHLLVLAAQGRDQLLQRDAQNIDIGARVDRQIGLPVAQKERAILVAQHQLAVLQHAAVLLAQDRQQHLVLQLGLQRVPVDVEERREARAGAVFEHIHPPAIGALADAHMIRHHIENLAHAARVQLIYQRIVLGLHRRRPG